MKQTITIPRLPFIAGSAEADYKLDQAFQDDLKNVVDQLENLLAGRDYTMEFAPEIIASVLDRCDQKISIAAAIGYLISKGYDPYCFRGGPYGVKGEGHNRRLVKRG